MTADLAALLNQLDAARAAALLSPLGYIPELAQDRDYPTDVNALHPDGGSSGLAECYGAETAALIVAAVNHLPQLIAAIRGVLEMHRPVSQNVYAATPVREPRDVCTHDTTTYWPCPTVAALTAALDPEDGDR